MTGEAERLKSESDEARAEQVRRLKESIGDFERVQKEDGGFDYFDPYGNKITVEDYVRATGKTKQSALEGSGSAQDQEFLQNYNMVKKMREAIYSGDKTTVEDIGTQLQEAGVDPSKIYPEDLMKSLIQSYPDYFDTADDRQPQQNEVWNRVSSASRTGSPLVSSAKQMIPGYGVYNSLKSLIGR
jgi:hypothetical protein